MISYEEYHPFGSTSFHTVNGGAEVSAKRYRYTGKERDDETGLYYYGARYYASWLGRWTGCDPSVKDGFNLLVYVRNNPVVFYDDDGLESKKGFFEKVLDLASDFAGGVAVSVGYNNVKPVESISNAFFPEYKSGRIQPRESQLDKSTKALVRQKSDSISYQLGRLTGDVLGIVQGIKETAAGVGIAGGGLVAEGPSLGTSTAVVVGGAALAAHGGGITIVSAADAGKRLVNIGAMAMAAVSCGGNKSDKSREVENSAGQKVERKFVKDQDE